MNTRTKFEELSKLWHKETAFLSSSDALVLHPAYQDIIQLGREVVPILLDALRKAPDHWDVALHQITGESPVPLEHWGDIPQMSADWVEWGKRRGFLIEECGLSFHLVVAEAFELNNNAFYEAWLPPRLAVLRQPVGYYGWVCEVYISKEMFVVGTHPDRTQAVKEAFARAQKSMPDRSRSVLDDYQIRRDIVDLVVSSFGNLL